MEPTTELKPEEKKRCPADKAEFKPDLLERGSEGQTSNRRLFCQLQVFTGCVDTKPLIRALQKSGLDTVLYLDANDPQGVAVLVMTEEPNDLVGKWRLLLNSKPFTVLERRSEFTMTGRTYSFGREADLEDWILQKPRRAALDPKWAWAIWYPLRRKPEFELLSRGEQSKVLMEHASIGMAYGREGIATDIRLQSYGLDKNDNEFVLGLVSENLHSLSKLIQDMRKTQQTANYMDSLGPFFVGKVLWQSKLK